MTFNYTLPKSLFNFEQYVKIFRGNTDTTPFKRNFVSDSEKKDQGLRDHAIVMR